MIVIKGLEVYSDSGKWVHRIGTETYFKRGTILKGDTADKYEEADAKPEMTESEYETKVKEAVRQKYTDEQIATLTERHNAYALGIDDDAKAEEKYKEYLQFVAKTRKEVRPSSMPTSKASGLSPRIGDIAKLMAMQIGTLNLTDEQSLTVKSLYPEWEVSIGKAAAVGDKMQYGGRLWKVIQAHTISEQWKPGTGTESLFTEIVESATGTAKDPIAYNGNMELRAGKYYSQGGKVYLCSRDTVIPVYAPLANLIGLYVTETQ